MIHLFVDASAASSGSGPTYVRNVAPRLAARTDVRSTVLVSSLLRQEFQNQSNVSFVEFADDSERSGQIRARSMAYSRTGSSQRGERLIVGGEHGFVSLPRAPDSSQWQRTLHIPRFLS